MYGNKSIKKRKDGSNYKDFYYYGCKHRNMTRGHKCDYKKQVHEEMLDASVAEVISKLVSNPKFSDLIRNKINMEVDTSALDQEIENYKIQLRKLYHNKDTILSDMDSLDYEDKHYQRRKTDLENGIMLEIIIEENCTNREYIVAIMEKLDEFIRNIVSSQNLDSLRYFVVADTEIENYCDSVKYYARLLNKDTYLTNDGSYFVAGKTIEGKISGGEYVQAIIIKSGLIIGMYNDLLLRNGVPKENVPDMGDMRNIGLVTVVHEIGHAVDNANVYSLSGCIDNKLLFNLDLELDEYIEKNSYSLWGEYFAESFPYRVLGAIDLVADNKEEQLKECIENFSKEKSRNAIVERVYRILYLYVHCIAGIHFQKITNFDYDKYTEDEIVSDYIPFLARTEIAMINLLKDYPNWNVDTCMDEMSQIIKDMIEFEKEH